MKELQKTLSERLREAYEKYMKECFEIYNGFKKDSNEKEHIRELDITLNKMKIKDRKNKRKNQSKRKSNDVKVHTNNNVDIKNYTRGSRVVRVGEAR